MTEVPLAHTRASRARVTIMSVPIPGLPPAPDVHISTASTLEKLTQGARHFFRKPQPLPPVAERARAVLDSIDWSDPTIVIWVPGTNEWWVKREFAEALHALEAGHRIVMIPYQATWRFSDSTADGLAVLRLVLEEIGRRRPGARVLLGGESQGAWIAGLAMTEPRLRRVVTRAVLAGHPGVSPVHFHDGADSKVAELNNPLDLVTLELGSSREQVVRGVELLARKRFIAGLPPILGYAAERPEVLWRFVRSQLWRVPGLQSVVPDAHDYTTVFEDAAAFLVHGRRPESAGA